MMRKLWIVLLAVIALWLLAAPAQAQTATLNPTTLSFTASADHSVTVGGVEVLTKYEARYSDGTSTVLVTDLGKPTPSAGTIAVPVNSTGLPKNKVLTVVVFAIGPGGSSGSAASNPFAYLAAPASVGSPTVQ